jgi:hypothetical protein
MGPYAGADYNLTLLYLIIDPEVQLSIPKTTTNAEKCFPTYYKMEQVHRIKSFSIFLSPGGIHRKKAFQYSCPQPGCHLPNSGLGTGISKSFFYGKRNGRVRGKRS